MLKINLSVDLMLVELSPKEWLCHSNSYLSRYVNINGCLFGNDVATSAMANDIYLTMLPV
jgi:hypothetical protein